jgi:succinate dehydrogenase / fumarate reductase membrane anchor subunit
VALIVLTLWGVASALTLAKGGYDGARVWMSYPVNAVLIALMAAAGFYHVQIGVRTIIEDYFHAPLAKTVLLILNAFVCLGGAALTLVCLLKVAVGGGAS